MGEKGNISEYRGRLDKTLSCHDLVNEDVLNVLIKNQILSSSNSEMEDCIDNIVERRTKELATTLGMLRSASLTDGDKSPKPPNVSNGGWKVKQDSEEFRVMYREGPEGTPFHTLLVEGYVDGPVDVCLCISWEADLFKKWWPQSTIPHFKIACSQCLQKVRIGEQIALVRMKLSWPLSTREAIVHFFEFDYFQDDLIVVLFNSISDVENVDTITHGFTRDGISDADDVVRIDVVGGLAIQKVTTNRSYIRTIANMDVKLDFIPPAFINFVSRQLVGGGFKLFKKEVASVSKGVEYFSKALKDPLYDRVREALYSDSKSNREMEMADPKNNNDEQTNDANEHKIQEKSKGKNICSEIEEIDEEDGESKDFHKQDFPRNQIILEGCIPENKKIVISPEVQEALETLEKAISFIRENGCNSNIKSMCKTNFENSLNKDETEDSKLPENSHISENNELGTTTEISRKESTQMALNDHRISSSSHSSRRTSSSLCIRETSHNKIAPASPDVANPSETHHHADSHSSGDRKGAESILENIMKDSNLTATATPVNCSKEDRTGKRKTRKLSYCCYNLLSRQIST